MKYLRALLTGVLEAIKVLIIIAAFIVTLNIISDYFEGKDIQVYFTLDFVLNFASQPLMLGVFAAMVLLSCINQIVGIKRENT